MRFLKMPAVALILILSAFPAAAFEPSTSCQALAAWAANLEKLPTDYASFTSLPVSHRRAVYQRLSAAERAGLWQHQWQAALLHPGWNAEQRALIAEANLMLTASTLAAAAPSDAVRALGERVALVFPRADAMRVFYQLGPRESMIEANAMRDCNCSQADGICEMGSCQPEPCFETIGGCGLGWQYPCDGLCR